MVGRDTGLKRISAAIYAAAGEDLSARSDVELLDRVRDADRLRAQADAMVVAAVWAVHVGVRATSTGLRRRWPGCVRIGIVRSPRLLAW